jgi:hypothetical protein
MHSVDIPFPQQKDETEQIQNMGRGMHHGKRHYTTEDVQALVACRRWIRSWPMVRRRVLWIVKVAGWKGEDPVKPQSSTISSGIGEVGPRMAAPSAGVHDKADSMSQLLGNYDVECARLAPTHNSWRKRQFAHFIQEQLWRAWKTQPGLA